MDDPRWMRCAGGVGLLLAALVAGCAGSGGPENARRRAAPETLTLFVANDGSDGARRFRDDSLPIVSAIADEFSLPLVVRDAQFGVPAEIAGTPTLLFQNHAGRSVYVGRFSTPDRIRSFVRTARRIAQGSGDLTRENVALWTPGRARVAAPFKITALGGSVPEDHDADRFELEITRALVSGMSKFELVDRVVLRRTDRSVSIDVHPYRAEDGTLYLSASIFSQFHCHEPRWSIAGEELSGAWSSRTALLEEAGSRLEAAALQILDESGGEDRYVPISEGVPVRRWAELGLSLPPAPPDTELSVGTGTLPSEWMTPNSMSPAPIAFRFPAPLDAYSGEAQNAEGTLTLTGGEAFTGKFEVEARSVTMGEPDLDYWVHGSQVLDVKDFPVASFEIDSAIALGGVEWGRATPIDVSARLGLIGHTIPVRATGTLVPEIAADGTARLRVEARFEIPLGEPIGISGPDGPEEARNRLLIEISVPLVPVETD